MSQFIPETFNRQDWPRQVSRVVNKQGQEIKSLQTASGTGFDLGDSGPDGGGALDMGTSS